MPETSHESATKDPATNAQTTDGVNLNAEATLSNGAFTKVPIEIIVAVGRARPLVRDLLRLQRDSVLQLDRRIEDPVELYVGDRLIARGVLEELDGDQAGQMAVRLTEVADLSNGL